MDSERKIQLLFDLIPNFNTLSYKYSPTKFILTNNKKINQICFE